MNTRKRSLAAGMTDYTGVSIDVILTHLREWRDETGRCIESLKHLQDVVESHSHQLNRPNDIVWYVEYFIDLLERYLGDFDRLLSELPHLVTIAHVDIVQQLYKSASHEEDKCLQFSRDYINCKMKDEGLRWLVDEIYKESRGMLIDYLDLSNLVPRLRTFIGSAPKLNRELEQKFGILFSAAQERRDFDLWATEATGVPGYAIGVVFIDIDEFKRLNSIFTESTVDRTILPAFQQLVRAMSLHRGAAYRHGGEEFLVLLPNCAIEEAAGFAENLRARIQAEEFTLEGHEPVRLTVSVGVAAWPAHGKTLEEVIHAANQAEHAAKKAGKNRVCIAETT